MNFPNYSQVGRIALALVAFTSVSCGSGQTTAPAAKVPVLTTVTVAATASSIQMGQTTTLTVTGANQDGVTMALGGTVTWSSSAATVATISATGIVTGVAIGTADITATVDGKSGKTTVSVVASPGVKINEVESSGGTPGDWVEIYNPTAAAVDISGWGFRDNDPLHVIYKVPAGTSVAAGGYYLLEEAAFGFGLGAADDATLYNAYGAIVELYSWTAHATTTYGRCPNGTGAFITTTSSTKGAANDCSVPVRVNEVESNGGTPGDWIELYNFGTSTIDISGWGVRDNDSTHVIYKFPTGTTIAPGGYFLAEEAQFGFGLGAADEARLYNAAGVTVDVYAWTAHAAITYGRCPDGTGSFQSTTASTKGTANSCSGSPPPAPTASAWFGADDVVTVDGTAVFGGNLSGLIVEPASGSNSSVMWGARNGPGSIFRLLYNGTIWAPDPTNGWSSGKLLKYPDGTGEPDTEDITFTTGSAAGIYTIAERNNSNNGVSRNSILLFDPSGTAATLTATREWDLTADLPVTGANLGIEAITWIPDSALVAKGFIDEAKGRAYSPADYANHGTGIFFIGVEANGIIYAYALNHTTNTFTRVASFSSGFPAGVMALQYDRDFGYLWAACDDGCGGLMATFEIASSGVNQGKYVSTRVFNRPPSMPNINNEGFAVSRNSECTGGRKFVYWADDSETGGHAIRRASIACTALP